MRTRTVFAYALYYKLKALVLKNDVIFVLSKLYLCKGILNDGTVGVVVDDRFQMTNAIMPSILSINF